MLGTIHFILACLCLAAGACILLAPKGTRVHIRLGWAYLSSMMTMNLSALFIRHLTGGFNVFHIIALISLTTTSAGIVQILFRARIRRWLWRHYQYMSWSYVSLLAGACNEAFVHIPRMRQWKDATLHELPLIASCIILLAAAIVIFRRQASLLARYEWANG